MSDKLNETPETESTPRMIKAMRSEEAMSLMDLMDLIGSEIVKENEINVPSSFEQIHWVANKGYWDSGNGPYDLKTSLRNLETTEWKVVLPGVHPPIDFQDFVHNKEESDKPNKVNWQKEGF